MIGCKAAWDALRIHFGKNLFLELNEHIASKHTKILVYVKFEGVQPIRQKLWWQEKQALDVMKQKFTLFQIQITLILSIGQRSTDNRQDLVLKV